jgi:hypothetical protein
MQHIVDLYRQVHRILIQNAVAIFATLNLTIPQIATLVMISHLGTT